MKLLFLNSYSEDGNMCESLEPGVGKKNSELFFKKNNILMENTVFLNIINNNIVKEYNEDVVETKPFDIPNITADAIITRKSQLFIYQKFGDCVPLTIFDENQNILVFAHVGIYSIFNKLHIEIIKELINNYNCKPINLKCYLGPSIKKDSYLKKIENNEVIKEFEDFLVRKGEMYSIDLPGIIVNDLINMNISKDNIEISDIDTAKDKRYFSHYRSKNDPNLKEERFIYGVMMINE